MTRIKLGTRWVGVGEPAFIIAEIGSNHDRDLEQAKQLIRVAANAGTDAVKFQLFTADDLYAPGDAAYDSVRQAELPWEWLPRLRAVADDHHVAFLASPFSKAAVDQLDELGVPALKWASSETVNLPLLKYAAARKRPILLSTGMCRLADIEEAVMVVRSEHDDLVLLQCTSLYPTGPEDVHLAALDTLRTAFNTPVGFSDHTLGISIPIAAVARGACVIEKHLTLDRSLPGPDHSYALEPDEFAAMVAGIRAAERAIGSREKRILPQEEEVGRRVSLRAARDIDAGEILSAEQIVETRPGGGLPPRLRSVVLGRRTRRPLAKGEALTWDVLTDDSVARTS